MQPNIFTCLIDFFEFVIFFKLFVDPTVSALMDSEEKYNALLWQQICSKLETSFLGSLHCLPLANSSPIKNQLQKRHFLLEALCTLLPISHVWSKYCAIRVQDLHKLCLQVLHFQLGPRSKVNFTHLADDEQTTSSHRMATGSSGHDMYLINLNQFLKLLPSFFNKVKVRSVFDDIWNVEFEETVLRSFDLVQV